MGIKFEVIAAGETYTNKAGEEKKRWNKIGVVMETAKGLSLKMETVPVNWNGWAMLSEPKPREEKPKAGGFDDLDDMPF
jgi:hypothetical protein